MEDNKIPESSNDPQEFEFTYNFINTPWDDRSNRSKAGIVTLLVAIFIATAACVANNFVIHYRGFDSQKATNHSETNCFRVKIEEYRYVARIYSASTKELLCVGAVVSPTSIIANGACVKSGPIRVHIGSNTDRICKKGFPIDVVEPINHDAVVTQKLVLLSSYEDMKQCTHVVRIGNSLDWKSKVHIIGRPISYGSTLSRQLVTLAGKDVAVSGVIRNLKSDNMICVQDLARCPVGVGDLLVQNGLLYGLAVTSVQTLGRNRVACFAELSIVQSQLKEINAAMKI